jgi:putative endopeptidase
VNSSCFPLAASFTVLSYSQTAPLKGIETGDLDRKADPCTDFFQFSNGAWRADNPIPSSMDRWSRRWEAGEANKDQLRVILDDVSSQPEQPKGTPAQLTGDFHAACTNQKAINKAGIRPLQPLLQRVADVHDVAGLQAAIIELHSLGVQAPFNLSGSSDLHDPGNVIADIGAAGLGLPDRDYYLKPEKRFVDARAGYLVHVAKILRLAGSTEQEAADAAQKVMAFETALAKASLDNLALRDPASIDHKMSFDQLRGLIPHFDWTAYYRSAGLTPAGLNVEEPASLKEVERQILATPIADWKIYLRWQLLNSFSDNLSEPFIDEHFNFYQKQLAGVSELKPRPIRCSEETDNLLGEALGQEYVKRYFPPEAKARSREMVDNIIAAMRDTIMGLDWMTPTTKQKALQKLASINVKVGYPDKWRIIRASPSRATATSTMFSPVNVSRLLTIGRRSASPSTAADGA